MAHETAVHRWDGQHAHGHAAPFDPVQAADGVDEYLDVVLRRGVVGGRIRPTASLHLHATDAPGEWWLAPDGDGGLALRRAHEKGDLAVRSPAGELLLAVWGRRPLDGLDVHGDVGTWAGWRR